VAVGLRRVRRTTKIGNLTTGNFMAGLAQSMRRLRPPVKLSLLKGLDHMRPQRKP